MPHEPETTTSFDAFRITRPDGVLLRYYVVTALLTGPLFPITILPLYFKYHTLRYRFDESGISMSWGILFRREVYLAYRRIQDIHLTRNIIQRWMGLATVGVQTASGSATPEMSIEGILEYEALRDFLYDRMRGARGLAEPEPAAGGGVGGAQAAPQAAGTDEALALLREIRDLLRRVASERAEPPP